LHTFTPTGNSFGLPLDTAGLLESSPTMFHVVGAIVRLGPAASAGSAVSPANDSARAVAAETTLKRRRLP
jgi:hypothetical protein